MRTIPQSVFDSPSAIKAAKAGHAAACRELANTPRELLDPSNPNHPSYDVPTSRTIGQRPWTNGITFYVANLKGAVGDWGYTTRSSEAIHLSPHWQRRFSSDCKAVGVQATFHSI